MKILSFSLIFCFHSYFLPNAMKEINLLGAWESTGEGQTITTIFSEKYFASTAYSLAEKKFLYTLGGSWELKGHILTLGIEFNTDQPEKVGSNLTLSLEQRGENIISSLDGNETHWKHLDKGQPGRLAGAWLITGRKNGEKLQSITPGARRTMKILSGTRFQWIAYNAETKEFFGTGGGTYSTVDGKYTENIEFFSRDNSRVGLQLKFDFKLEAGQWTHQGFSSKGDPIHEIWTKREKIGL